MADHGRHIRGEIDRGQFDPGPAELTVYWYKRQYPKRKKKGNTIRDHVQQLRIKGGK